MENGKTEMNRSQYLKKKEKQDRWDEREYHFFFNEDGSRKFDLEGMVHIPKGKIYVNTWLYNQGFCEVCGTSISNHVLLKPRDPHTYLNKTVAVGIECINYYDTSARDLMQAFKKFREQKLNKEFNKVLLGILKDVKAEGEWTYKGKTKDLPATLEWILGKEITLTGNFGKALFKALGIEMPKRKEKIQEGQVEVSLQKYKLVKAFGSTYLEERE